MRHGSSSLAVIGYARVSTTDQNPQLQLDALEEAGATRIFTDHGVSASTTSRPHLDACLDHLREGDVLTVWKLDRLGRNTQHVLAVVDQLTSRGIGFRSLTEGLHTEGPMGTAMLTVMAAFAQLERDTMIERTRAGLAAAAANGRKGGRPRKFDDADAAKARSMRDKDIAATDIAKMLGVSRATVYRYLSDDVTRTCATPLPREALVEHN
jgi:DNA invertase Pin-like site-specific DNA recombinase